MSKHEREMNDARFVGRAVTASLIAGCLIFGALVAVITNWDRVSPTASRLLCSVGSYGLAEKAAEGIAEADTASACRYDIARKMYDRGRFAEAGEIFSALSGYSDSAEMLLSCRYGEAEKLYDAEDYEAASAEFYQLGGFGDAQTMYCRSQFGLAEKLFADGNVYGAIRLLGELGSFDNARDRALEMAITVVDDQVTAAFIVDSNGCTAEELDKISELSKLRSGLRTGALAVGWYHTVGLRSDGTAVACGLDESGQCGVEQWNGIVQVAAGAYHTVGLKADGTVVAVGDNSYGQCDIGEWKNVVGIAAGDNDTVALLSDGTVVSCGWHDYDISGWHGLTSVAAGSHIAAGIYGSGRVIATHSSVQPDPQAPLSEIAVANGVWMALTSTGSVESNINGLPDWTDVIAVSVSPTTALAIGSDGELRSYVFRTGKPAEVSAEDAVAVSAGGTHCAVLTSDGRVISFGENTCGECDTGEWVL